MKLSDILLGAVVGAALSWLVLIIFFQPEPQIVPMSETDGQTFTTAQLVSQAQTSVQSITPEAYKEMRDNGAEHILLDVREQEEWDAGHIEDSLFIPRGLLEFRVTDEIADKETEIVVLCKSGGRASLAGQTLQKLGYKNVSYIEGGYQEYSQL